MFSRESRDGPSGERSRGGDRQTFYGSMLTDTSFSSPVLKEISILRQRLKDLEEDTKSTMDAPSPSANSVQGTESELRKELAKLEDEKARQEVDFMNSIASLQMEKQTLATNLKNLLAQSKTENDNLLEEMRINAERMEQRHKDEIDRLTANLKMADDEIDSNTRVINGLLQKVSNLQFERDQFQKDKIELEKEKDHWHQQKQELFNRDQDHVLELSRLRRQIQDDEVSLEDCHEQLKERDCVIEDLQEKLKGRDLELEEAADEITQLHEDLRKTEDDAAATMERLGQMNDSISDLKENCETYSSQLKVTRKKLAEQSESAAALEIQLSELRSATEQTASASVQDRNQITQTIASLEERVQISTEQLKEKEERIEKLQSSLREEKRITIDLRKEMNFMKKKKFEQERSMQPDQLQQQQQLEIEQLKQQNREMTEELKALKNQNVQKSARSSQGLPAVVSTGISRGLDSPPRVSRLQQVWPPNSTTATTPTWQATPHDVLSSPRATVSGLAASFERRIKGKDILNETTTSETAASSDTDDSLSDPQELIAELRKELQREREAVASLHEEVGALSDCISRKGSFTSNRGKDEPDDQEEVLGLRIKIGRLDQTCEEYCKDIEDLRTQLKREKDVVHRLREEVSSYTGKLQNMANMERKFEDCKEEASRLQIQVDTLDDTRKLLTKENEDLRELMKNERDAIGKLREEISSCKMSIQPLEIKVREKEMEATRLRMELDRWEQSHQQSLKQIREMEQQIITNQQDAAIQIQEMEKQIAKDQLAKEELQRNLSLVASGMGKDNISFETKLREREHEIARLQMQIQTNDEQRKSSDLRIEQLERELKVFKEKTENINNDTYKKGIDEIDRLRQQVRALQSELNEAQVKLEKRQQEIDGLQTSLTKLNEEERAKSRSVFVSTRNHPSKANHDELIELKDELKRAQFSKSKLEKEYMTRVKDLETGIESVEAKAKQQIDELLLELKKVNSSLEKSKDEINMLQNEKFQLCSNMTNASKSRHQEIEELQSELIERTVTTTSQAREIQTLKIKIEEQDNMKLEKQKLHSRIKELEQEMARRNDGPTTHKEFDMLKAENMQLRQSIQEVKGERRTLQERLDSLFSDKTNSKSSQLLRERNEALRLEVERLTKRLKKMEEGVTRFAI